MPQGGASYADWRDRLATANDPEFWPITAIDELLAVGSAHFWCDGESALVTRTVTYPGGAAAVEILAAFGNLPSIWGAIVPQIETAANSIGARRLWAMGRPGWVHSAKANGWRAEMVVIVKDLT